MISFPWRAQWEHIFFFGLLFVLVLLGDGKQPVGDVVAAAGILSLFIVRHMDRKRTIATPPLLNIIWAGLIGYFILRTVFSDSIGYSISATTRWIMVYPIFVFFASQGQGRQEEKGEEAFSRALLWFGALVVLASVIATVFENMGRALPGMNLLYPTFGHNHTANIVVFVFPLVLYRLVQKKSWGSTVLALFFGAALVFSFARGAWVLIFGYLCYFFFTHRAFSVRTKRIVVGGLAITGATALTLIFLSKNLSQQLRDWPTLLRQLVKTSALESRLPYWKQAIVAIKERPLFGAGPGTFYLLSNRFQEAPNSYSWFAHSFPLELGAEIGLIGLIGAIWLTGYAVKRARRGPLFHGVVLTLIYGLYEINLNFLVIWFLLWAALGVLYTEHLRHKNNFLFTVALVIFMLFYTSSVAASFLGLFSATRPYAFYAEPYIVSRAVTRLSDPKIAPTDLRLIEFFHKKDPEVMMELAKSPASKRSEPTQQNEWFMSAVVLDPQNVTYVSDFINHLLEQGNSIETGRVVEAVSAHHLPQGSLPYLSQVDFLKDQLLPFYTKELFDDVGKPTTTKEFLAKTYYFLGLALIDRDPEQTRLLWTLARDSAPEWGYFHVELASLYIHNFYDEQNAKQVLIDCQKDFYARELCKVTLDDIVNTPETGTYKKEISGIQ